jgi:MOSC domain-containing protein YiiM
MGSAIVFDTKWTHLEGGNPMATYTGKLLSVNVGTVRDFEYAGRPARSAIWNSPVVGRIAVRGVNLAGDEQADRKAHGGPDKVVYAYAVEDARWWQQQIGRSLAYGEFGENLTTEGIEVNNTLVGERWKVGTTVLEVSEPRIPCWRLGVRMNDKMFPRQFTEALRPGSYFRLIVAGSFGAGDEIRVVERPDHGLTIRDVFRIYTRDREEAPRLLTVPRMAESWKRWAADWLQKRKSQPTEAADPGCCEA